jgi:hypothetical protein
LTVTLSLFQNIIQHSRSKDQFLRVSLKRLTDTQILDDELKETSELNMILLIQN